MPRRPLPGNLFYDNPQGGQENGNFDHPWVVVLAFAALSRFFWGCDQAQSGSAAAVIVRVCFLSLSFLNLGWASGLTWEPRERAGSGRRRHGGAKNNVGGVVTFDFGMFRSAGRVISAQPASRSRVGLVGELIGATGKNGKNTEARVTTTDPGV